jgi:hypothetical protein
LRALSRINTFFLSNLLHAPLLGNITCLHIYNVTYCYLRYWSLSVSFVIAIFLIV